MLIFFLVCGYFHGLWQGYAKLVGFDFSIGIEFELSILNLGFDIDSGLGEVLVLVSVLTQTGIKY